MSVTGKTPNEHAATEAGRRRVVKPRTEQQLGPEVRRVRGLPFAQVVTQWVRDPRYSANLRTLYAILVTYADVSARDTSKGRPYRSVLAAELGCATKTLDRTIREGEAAGLFRVEHRTTAKNPRAHDANVYHLHDAEFWAGEWVDPLGPAEQAADAAEKRRQERGLPARGGRKKPSVVAGDTGSEQPKEQGGVMGDATSTEGGVGTPVSPGGRDMDVPRGRDTSVPRGRDMDVPLDLEPGVENRSQDLSLSPLDLDVTSRTDAVEAMAAEAAIEREINPDAAHPDAETVVGAYAAALGRPVINGTRVALTRQASDLLKAGFAADWLQERVREMAANGWTDLLKHAERVPAPVGHTSPASPSGGFSGAIPRPRRAWEDPAAIAECFDCDRDGFAFDDALEVVTCHHGLPDYLDEAPF